MSTTAKDGDVVKLHYTGKLENGTIFDSSKGRDPLALTIGDKGVIPGFENAIIGMKVGDVKTIILPPETAYGEYQPDMILDIERSSIPGDVALEIGMVLKAENDQGDATHMTIKDFNDEKITLDGNHPLAGKTLIFEIELVEIL
ncbi:peptidylprolyl isomerase [Planctomycetota bacterium]